MDLRFILLQLCFFVSGFAALLYETAWTRELAFVFGTSELAVTAVLAAYMAGLALGAGAGRRRGPRGLPHLTISPSFLHLFCTFFQIGEKPDSKLALPLQPNC